MNNRIRKITMFVVLLVIISFWSVVLYFFSPQELIRKIGISNGYLFLFLSASLGGVSTITSSSFYATVYTVIEGGLNVFLVGIIGGIGVTIGDSFFYYLGYNGRVLVPIKLRPYIQSISSWLENSKKFKIQLFIFIYSGFTPLPNDLLTIPLGVNRYRYNYIFLPLLFGNICLIILLSVSIRYFSMLL